MAAFAHGCPAISGKADSAVFKVYTVSTSKKDSLEPLGTKRKFWFTNEQGKRILFKAEDRGTGEDWSEKVACELCRLLGLPHIHYDLAMESEGGVPFLSLCVLQVSSHRSRMVTPIASLRSVVSLLKNCCWKTSGGFVMEKKHEQFPLPGVALRGYRSEPMGAHRPLGSC